MKSKKKKNVKTSSAKKKVRKIRAINGRKTSSGTKRKRKQKELVKKVFGYPLQKEEKKSGRNKNTTASSDRAGNSGRNKSGTELYQQPKRVFEKISTKTNVKFRKDKTGKRIKVYASQDRENPDKKTFIGYRKYYELNLGNVNNMDQLIATVEANNFNFIDPGLDMNKIKGAGYSKLPQGVSIVITTKYGKQEHFSGGLSSTDFVVRKGNVKNLVLERLQKYYRNFQERSELLAETLEVDATDASENKGIKPKKGERLTDEEKEFNKCVAPFRPQNISRITISFIY